MTSPVDERAAPPSVYQQAPSEGRLWQGEVLSNVVEIRRAPGDLDLESPGQIARVMHPYALVMTPDCDLEQDFDAREGGSPPEQRLVPQLLMCEMHDAEALRGSHGLNSALWKRVRQNQAANIHRVGVPPPGGHSRDRQGSAAPRG